MTDKHMPKRALKETGARWLLTAQMALAFARCLLRLSEKDPRRALETARAFELWLTLAAAELACKITEHRLSENGGQPARHMYGALHVCVLLAHVVRHFMRQFLAKIALLPTAGWPMQSNSAISDQFANNPPYLDSS